MPDTVRHVMWYTVYDAKTGDLIASGTSEMCARRLGYKSANSFASASRRPAAAAGIRLASTFLRKSVSDVMR